jgi:hypothetical protein
MEGNMRRVLVVSAALLAGALASATPAAAHRGKSPKTCNGNVSGVTINANVAVPAGGACHLTDVTVKGDVKVLGSAYFQATDSSVRGDITGRRAQTLFVEGGSKVRGDVIASRSAQVFLFASTIGGRIHVDRTSDTVDVCGNTVRGDIAVRRSGRDILVGDPLAVDCAGNVVRRGDVAIEDNAVDVELTVRGNTISRGDLTVRRNGGPAAKVVESNVGGGRLDCRGNAQSFTAAQNTGWDRITGQCKP